MVKEIVRINSVLAEADRCVRNLNERVGNVKIEDVRKWGQNKGLLNLKHILVNVYDRLGKGSFID